MREHASRVDKQILQKALTLTAASVLVFSSLAMAAPALFSGRAFALGGNTLYVDSSGADTGDCQAASSPCQTIAYAISQPGAAGGTINLGSNISISSAVNINKSLTLDGNGYTLSPTFLNSGSSNNASIIVLSSNVTIQNLTIDGNSGTSLHGINVYEASGVTLNSVNVLNNDHAALVVNGSTVAATNFNTSGNGWGAVNVDPGSGVTTPSVFTLTSGTLSESNQIWSDGSHVSGSATVTVNASGYPMYKVGGTAAWYFWTNQPLENFAIIAKNGVTTAYTTIQAAVDDSAAGDTINVAPGTYNEDVTIGHKLTINGAQADVAAADTSTGTPRTGSESTISRFYITSSDVVINGFSLNYSGIYGQIKVLAPTPVSTPTTLSGIVIENNIFSGYDNVALPTNGAGNVVVQNNYFANPSANAEAMQIKGIGNSRDCNGSQILDNVFNAATTNGSADINLSCTGSGSAGVTVSGNRSMNASDPNGANMVAFSGVTDGIEVTNNVATTTGAPVFFFGNVSGSATITGNTFSYGGGKAVSINSYEGPSIGLFTISNNSFDNIGIKVGANALSGSGSVNASLNYWGSATPDFGTLISGNGVTTTPYFTNAAMTIRSDAKVLPDSSGNATANSTTPQVVVSSTSQPVTVTVAPGTSNASVDYSALVSGNTGTIPQTTISAPAATVSIPASTTVTASGGTWDGTITAPTTTTVSLGSGKTVATAVEVGADGLHLTFSNAVRLLLPGQANRLVGFVRNGDFTQIGTACTADDQATVDTQLSADADGDCYINAGSDMAIWTKHFTTFVAYSNTTSHPGGGPGTSSGSSNGSTGSPTGTSSGSSEGVVQGESTNNNGKTSGTNTETPVANLAQPKTAAKEANGGGLRWYWIVLIALAVIGLGVAGVYRYAEGTDRR